MRGDEHREEHLLDFCIWCFFKFWYNIRDGFLKLILYFAKTLEFRIASELGNPNVFGSSYVTFQYFICNNRIIKHFLVKKYWYSCFTGFPNIITIAVSFFPHIGIILSPFFFHVFRWWFSFFFAGKLCL